MEIDNLTPAAIWAANRQECSDRLWLVNRKLKDSGHPELRNTQAARDKVAWAVYYGVGVTDCAYQIIDDAADAAQAVRA